MQGENPENKQRELVKLEEIAKTAPKDEVFDDPARDEKSEKSVRRTQFSREEN